MSVELYFLFNFSFFYLPFSPFYFFLITLIFIVNQIPKGSSAWPFKYFCICPERIGTNQHTVYMICTQRFIFWLSLIREASCSNFFSHALFWLATLWLQYSNFMTALHSSGKMEIYSTEYENNHHKMQKSMSSEWCVYM